MSKLRAVSLVVVLAGLCGSPRILAMSLEYRVKAAFLFNFTKFVEWPASAFATPDAPFTLCVVGFNAFGDEVARVLANGSVQNRPILVHRLAAYAKLPACHLVFVAASAERYSSSILSDIADTPTLTIGEHDDFLELGGCIRFLLEEGRVKFQISRAATERAGLKVSSKLLRLSHAPQGSSW